MCDRTDDRGEGGARIEGVRVYWGPHPFNKFYQVRPYSVTMSFLFIYLSLLTQSGVGVGTGDLF